MSLTDWKTILAKIGLLDSLKTTQKKTLVDSINELWDKIASATPVTSQSATPFSLKLVDTGFPVSNTNAETLITSLTIPASMVRPTAIRFSVWGRVSNVYPSVVAYRFKVKILGATLDLIFDTGGLNIAIMSAGQNRRFKFEGILLLTETNPKIYSTFVLAPLISEGSTTLSSVVAAENRVAYQFINVPKTQNCELQFTCQMASVSPNVSFMLEGAVFY